jgi:regulator of sirC expression with transglutaminase-like and TPR domain
MPEEEARRRTTLDALRALAAGGGESVPLDLGAALVAAHEQPWLEPDLVVSDLDELAGGLHMPTGAPLVEQVARLNHHLFSTLGFCGDEAVYDAPFNSYLDRVLERRKGLPILLSLVYLEVARRVGVACDGVSFPGHFLVGTRGHEPRFFVDPFHRGAVLREDQLLARLAGRLERPVLAREDAERYLAPCTNRALLVRMNRNLKASFLRRRDDAGALRAVDRLLILAPDEPELLRDRALLLARLDRPADAIDPLQRYLELRPQAEDTADLTAFLKQLEELG